MLKNFARTPGQSNKDRLKDYHGQKKWAPEVQGPGGGPISGGGGAPSNWGPQKTAPPDFPRKISPTKPF